MFKNTISLAVWVLLSGCAFMNQEQSLNKTLEAVSNSEQDITRQIEDLDSTLNKQAVQINDLKAKITSLNNDVVLLKERRLYSVSAKISKDITPNLNASSNAVLADLAPQVRTGMVTLGSLEKIY
jgi:predicted  nucleic acid-binding Zn-ribbon protein